MKIIGIIAEYNPFHNGHAYQLSKIREETGADYIAVAMSGDFVQRGEPAIIDKYARTEMALQSGADLALELPVLWSTASAEAFAMASVTLFEKMGCVDGICFGAETDNLPLLTTIADILTDEPEDYRRLLSSFLKKGMSFPSARAQALCEINTENSSFKTTIEILSDILSSPNNILAIEYLKALKRLHSSMKPILLKRIGAGYHDTEINAAENNSQKKAEAIPTASATAIRNLVFSKNTVISPVIPASPASVLLSDVLQSSMPDSALRILTDYLKQYPPIHVDDFSPLLGYQLLTRDKSSISHIGDITPEIANRLYNNRYQYHSFSQFCQLNKSREVTYTRISRILLHLILQITEDTYALGCFLDYIPYLRILGFKKCNSSLLSVIKKSASVPMISKLADASVSLSPEAIKLLGKDIFAADLYEQTKGIKNGTSSRSEYAQEIVRI